MCLFSRKVTYYYENNATFCVNIFFGKFFLLNLLCLNVIK